MSLNAFLIHIFNCLSVKKMSLRHCIVIFWMTNIFIAGLLYSPSFALNTSPTLSILDSQFSSAQPVSFTISDAEGGDITVVVSSSDHSIISNSMIDVSSSGKNSYTLSTSPGVPLDLTITFIQVSNQYGRVTITVTAIDSGLYSSTDSFNVIFSPPDSGNALSFNGTSNYINIGERINISNSSFTIEFWTKNTDHNKNNFIISQGINNSINNNLHIGFLHTNVFIIAFYLNDLVTSQTFTDSDWHHWATTYDSNTNERKIYRDGSLIASDIAASDYSGSGEFYIAGKFTDGAHYYSGHVDELRFWNIANRI